MPLSKTGDIETGFDEAFEWKWIRFEHSIWLVMIVVVIVGLAGGLGRGPLAKAQAAAAPIEVEYERVVRYQTPTQITVTFSGQSGIERLFVGRPLLDRLQLESIVPRPAAAEPGRDGVVLLFPRSKTASQVTLVAQPATLGRTRTAIGLPEGPRVTFSQLVLP
jgi:hypothetical protein